MARITTATSVESIKAVVGRQIEHPDTKVPGLALRVSPAGKKSWTMRYRTKGGEQRRLTLGPYPSVGLSKARELALKTLGHVAEGLDPAAEKRNDKAEVWSKKLSTVATLLESYFEDAARGRHKPNARPKRLSTLTMEKEYYERLIGPRFGSLPVIDLTRHDVQSFLDEISETAPASARHCRNIIRQAYNYGIRREVVWTNPAQLTDLLRSQSRERVLTDDELRAIWKGATQPKTIGGLQMSELMGLAMCLALITLQRGSEVCEVHARELDRDARLWTIPGTRTKNHHTHAVPLSEFAIKFLDEAFALAAMKKPDSQIQSAGEWKGYAFPSPRTPNAITRRAFSRAMKRLTRALEISDATPHDFRRTGSTNITGERIGIPRFIVSRILNQLSDTGGAATVTAVYDRNEYLPEKRRALEAWSTLLKEIIDGRSRANNVIQIGRRVDAS